MSETLLDASALLALLNDEPGATFVAEALREGASISAVNLAEVVGKIAAHGISPDELRLTLRGFALEVIAFDEAQAVEAGRLVGMTSVMGPSLGDCACLACARGRGLTALTADRAWQRLEVGVRVLTIR